MKLIKWILLILAFQLRLISYGQCYNADFENGDFSGWQGARGSCCPINLPNNGILNGRQTIMSPGIDPNTCGLLSTVYDGNFSARLGNSNNGSQAEGLSYTLVVSPTGSLIQYAYAVVFQDPGHIPQEQPRFSSRVILQDGSVIPCTEYSVRADSNIPGFQTCLSGLVPVVWKDWTVVTVDLSAYVGQSVTFEFETGDCDLGAHFGYAYLDAIYCIDNEINLQYCYGDTLATLSAPLGFDSYLWDNGDTTAITIIDPNIWTNISCQVTTNTGCQIVINTNVLPTIVNSDFNYFDQCNGNFSFNNVSNSNSNGTLSYLWDFGDGTTSNLQNPTHNFNVGNWNVSLVSTSLYGCQDSISYPVSVYYSSSSFTPNDICLGSESIFMPDVINSQLIYEWLLGDGTTSYLDSLSHTYLNIGEYQVSLISQFNGSCPDTSYGTVNVRDFPKPSFITQNVCEGSPSYFLDTSILPTWSVDQYFWDFGDGATSNLQNPTHTYLSYGNYQVSLQISSSDGSVTCESSSSMLVTVHPNPISDFIISNECANDTLQINNLSNIPTGQISDYIWILDNNFISNSESPVYVHPQPGSYQISLTSFSAFGCFSNYLDTLEIYPLPNIQSTNDTICEGDSAILNASGGEYYSWSPTSFLQTPNSPSTISTPLETTLYSVTGTDNNGCSNTSQSIVVVNDIPILISEDVSICNGDSVELTISGASTYIWSPTIWLDQYSGPSVISRPDSSISYIITGVNDNGCSSQDTISISVMSNPVILVNSGGVCQNSSGSPNSILITASGASTYTWSPSTFLNSTFGSQVVSTPQSDITYTVIGTSNENCIGSAESTISFYPESIVSFSISDSSGCSPLQINFSDSSSQNIISWNWSFGDGSFSTDQNPTHIYDNSGYYTIGLQVETINGCFYLNNNQGSVLVYPNPIAEFYVSSIEVDEISPTIGIVNSSIGGSLYTWNFGDGTYSYLQNPISHSYTSSGLYQIDLGVENGFGCLDSTSVLIQVNPSYTFYISNSFTPNSDGINDIFFGRGIGYKKVEMRIFDRWGELIFDNTSILGPNIISPYWNGRLNGIDCQIDVYNYQFLVTDIFDIVHIYRGSVSLIR